LARAKHSSPAFTDGPNTIIACSARYKLWQHEGQAQQEMARKKKLRRFRAVQAVKELARERMGTPPAGKVVLEKRKKPEKHKPTFGKLLSEND